MSRLALEKTALRLLKSRMEQKNGIQATLVANGIYMKIEDISDGMPEIMSEDTFMELLIMQEEQDLSTDINDEGWENDDLNDDGLTFI